MIPQIQTRSLAYMHFVDVDPTSFDIEDIAHALAMTNRFAGHTPFPYSVAQHSVLASYEAPRGMQFEALMHDAHEAYIGDVSTTLKQLLPDFRVVERRMESALRRHYGLPERRSALVKQIDLRMLATECDQLGFTFADRIDAEAYDHLVIEEWDWREAKAAFLLRFQELAP